MGSCARQSKVQVRLGDICEMSPIYLTSLYIFLICNKNVNRKSICLIKLDRIKWKNQEKCWPQHWIPFPPPFPLCFSFLFTITCLLSSAGNNAVNEFEPLNLSYKIWVWCSTLHCLLPCYFWHIHYTFPEIAITHFLLILKNICIPSDSLTRSNSPLFS